MENLLVEQKNSFNFLLKKMPKNIINSNNYIDLSNIKIGLMIDDVLEAIKKIPDKSISTVVTSPPYWNLRDYKDNRQIGNEKNPLEFVNKIALVGKEILRILKDDGAYFLNIGDTYVDQSLQMIPQKIAIKMQEQGWLIRNQIIWYKPNHMPSPVKNRFSNTYEVIYFFTKNDWEKKVNFNLDAIRIPHKSNFKKQNPKIIINDSKFINETKNKGASPAARLVNGCEKYTIKRNIIASQKEISDYLKNALNKNNINIATLTKILGEEKYKYKASHWFRVDAGGSYPSKEDWKELKKILKFNDKYDNQMLKEYKYLQSVESHPKGKNPGDLFIANTAKSKYKHFAVFPEEIPELAIKSCCPENEFVLDPFAGSGTTGVVANRLNRKCILIEVQKDFAKIIKERIKDIKIL